MTQKWATRKRLFFGGGVIILLLLAVRMCVPDTTYKDNSLLDLLVLYRAELEAPGLTVEAAAQNLKTPQAAYEFVRDRTLYSPYYGHRQNSDTMLRTRSGNALDRAYLLTDLLKAMGWTVEMHLVSVYAPFTDALPSSGQFGRRGGKLLKEIAGRIGYDLNQENADWQDMFNQLQQQVTAMQGKVTGVADIVNDRLRRPYTGSGYGSPDELRVYILATKEGEDQLYFNPTFPDMEQPEAGNILIPPSVGGASIELWLRDGQGINKPLLKWKGQTAGRDISLAFMPTHNPLEILNGPPDPKRVAMWTPMLNIEGETISGRPFRTDGETPGIGLEVPDSGITGLAPFDPQAITDMRLVDIDTANYPDITLQLALDGVGRAAMMPQHFLVMDNAKQVNVRLNKITYGGHTVSIVSDVSGSMVDIGAFEISKKAIVQLADKLSPELPVSLISFAYDARMEVEMAPLGNGDAIRQAASKLQKRDYTGIFNALNKAAKQDSLVGGTIVLLTDGMDNVGGSEAETIKYLQERNIRVIAIGLSEEADHALITRIAEATGGFALKITKVEDLDAIYARIGRFLSAYASLSYHVADPETARADIVRPANIRQLSVQLKETKFQAAGQYDEPVQQPKKDPMLYVIINDRTYGAQISSNPNKHQDRIKSRDILRLNGPNIAYALTGQIKLYFDDGMYAPDVVAAAYMTNWIEALRSQPDKQPSPQSEAYVRPSYDLVSTVNGFRVLSSLGSGTGAMLSGGTNIYMKRTVVSPGRDGMREHAVFDVVDRVRRAYGAKSQEDTFRLEVALNIAEGMMIGGENAIDALLPLKDSLQLTGPSQASPDYWTGAMEAVKERYGGEHRYWFTSADKPQWMWMADNDPAHYFAGLYLDGGVLAKGASIEGLAAEFDKIDKMYELYTKMAGKAPGLYASSGVFMGAIAAFKREENKLWCYSTLMLGYVNEAIGADEALLNTSPKKAQAKAAKLCKMNYNPDDFAREAGKAVAKSLYDAAKSWAIKPVDKEIKDAATLISGVDAGMISSIKGHASDIASVANGLTSVASAPTTAAFHKAMSNATGLAGNP